jgi:membrane-associated protease RseP (regulator of RpoE activity)
MSGPVCNEFPAKIARTLVFGSVALMGGMLALAQVAAPPAAPSNAQKQPPAAPQFPQAVPQNRTGLQPQANQPERPLEQPARPDERRQVEQARQNQQPQGERGQRRDQVADGRADRRQGLGIQFDQQAQGGLTVSTIEQGSIAAEAGLRTGDRIVSVDGRQITRPRQFQAYLSGQYGREIPVVVNRGGEQQTVYLTSAEQRDKAAWLGVFLNDNQENQRGAKVVQVYPAGPAARAGLRPGDVITGVNGQEVEGSADLIAAIEEQEAGSKAVFDVLRNDQQTKLTAVLGNRDNFIFHGQGEDNFFGGRQQRGEFGRGGPSGEDDFYANIPPFAMQLEHDRRMAEQHERMENQLIKLQDEVRQLRELIQQQRK